jgi:hypothetical protein
MPIPEGEDQRLAELEKEIERSLKLMYDSPNASAGYALAKDAFSEAIALARQLGLTENAAKLEARLKETKAIFRGQLPG